MTTPKFRLFLLIFVWFIAITPCLAQSETDTDSEDQKDIPLVLPGDSGHHKAPSSIFVMCSITSSQISVDLPKNVQYGILRIYEGQSMLCEALVTPDFNVVEFKFEKGIHYYIECQCDDGHTFANEYNP